MKFAKSIITVLIATTISAQSANVLCIGLNEYANYSNLNHAENDATEIASLFESLGHEVTLLTATNVTKDNVTAAIATEPEFIYFAGHGEKGRLILNDGEILLSEIANANTTMFLDCCYVGGELKQVGTMKILAAAEYEAFESDGHGLFTKYLMTWLA
ncbi:MAG: caspase family protein, partial [Verrucomicrobia bacterium]|nr:caspase family protein [Verrucomicrobiota bacterium]